MNLIFPVASAQEAGQAAAPSLSFNLLLIGGMLLLFYFILWRPQSKQRKEHQELVNSISKGDEVMTSGGLLGTVQRVSDEYLAIEVADGVELKLQKSSVAAALPKGTISRV